MDINELKQIIKNQTNVLVMENGKPEFVVMDYEYFKKLTGPTSESKVQSQAPSSRSQDVRQPYTGAFNPAPAQRNPNRDQEILERLNNEILALKNQMEQEEQKAKDVNID